MQLRFVEIFCAVVEQRSFSKGARAHGVTQSSASQAVSALERRLGTRLIDRSQRPLELTPEGRVYYDGCRDLLGSYRAIEDRVRGQRDRVAGPVRVAAIYSVGLMQMGRFVRRFEDTYLDVQLRLDYLHPDEVYDRVLTDQADLGLVSFPRPRAELVCLEWQQQPMVLVAPPGHHLAGQVSLEPRELDGESFIGFTPELPIRKEIDRWLRKHRVQVDQRQQFDNIETIKKAVECGPGVALLPAPTVWQEVASGSLVAVPLAGEPLMRPLGIIHKKHRQHSAAVQKFIELLRQEAGDRAGEAPVPIAPARNGSRRGRPRQPVAAAVSSTVNAATGSHPARRKRM